MLNSETIQTAVNRMVAAASSPARMSRKNHTRAAQPHRNKTLTQAIAVRPFTSSTSPFHLFG